MAKEIERKFLVVDASYKRQASHCEIRQGYLNSDKERTVRVRTIDDKAFLTIKGRTHGVTRDEFEYEIPYKDACVMLDTLAERPLIEKNRYLVKCGGFLWEIDEFFGENSGLTVAEIELPDENETFERPAWLGEEVSDDPRYFNSNLVKNPYRNFR